MVGYGTNWLAVKMMMYPVEFRGLGPLGWQGVIPANSKKMANVVVDHSVKRVLSQQELLSRIESDKLIESLQVLHQNTCLRQRTVRLKNAFHQR